jgi:hypothetical protein
VQTRAASRRVFLATAARIAKNIQSISPPRAGEANANKPKVTAIRAIALIANDQ